ncbi:MAG TPA: PDZ domain-containing protein [Pyrinomonadaceae bacterium]|jgi:S1-C subfamily serine protease|nr:PDZ domain-containing protein [Pyrinomonadaceae bacterium]
MKFTLAQTKAHVSSRRRARGFAHALVLPVLLCAAHVRAQDTVTPAVPQTPPAAAAPRTPRPGTQRAPVAQPAAPVARPAAVVAPPAGAQAVTPAPKAAPAIAAMPPRQVVTVVHRLRGWKLLAWLATTVRPSFELDELPSPSDVHTNIVAGYISDDGRTVVARLPQAESDLDFPAPDSNLFEPTPMVAPKPEPEYTVITSDGRSVEAKFVGLDATTGLSLLEASSALMSKAPPGVVGDTDDPTVGQRVLFYAPAPAPPARPPAAAPTPGLIYVSIDEKEGRLTEVINGPSGKPFRLVARTPGAAEESIGSVVANEIGDVIGIVSQTGTGGTQIVPMANALGARERVMRLRASAPQPWVGIRGEAAFQQPLEAWVGFGWKPEAALPLIQNGNGVFLTKVAPGAPAALAGLKPGDLISRIGARDVRTVEDLSLTLKEAGVGSSLDFTVWRALEPEPLKFTVRLAATRNPAREFEEAEWPARNAPAANPAVSADIANALDAARSLRAFGVGGLRMTRRGAARLGARGGMLVVAVRPGSPAASCGLRAGDVIETANGAEFAPAELRRMLANRAAEPVSLGVVRGGARTNITYKYTEESEP